jgi:hypothetical protein
MIVALIDPTVLHDIVALTNTILLWLTPLLLAWVVRIQIKNGKLTREEAAETAKTAVSIAQQVAEVKTVAAEATKQSQEQSEKILILADKTHTLVNSQTGIMLTTIYEQSLRLFKLTGDPIDAAKVEVAKKKLGEHEAKQHVVDLKESQGS